MENSEQEVTLLTSQHDQKKISVTVVIVAVLTGLVFLSIASHYNWWQNSATTGLPQSGAIGIAIFSWLLSNLIVISLLMGKKIWLSNNAIYQKRFFLTRKVNLLTAGRVELFLSTGPVLQYVNLILAEEVSARPITIRLAFYSRGRNDIGFEQDKIQYAKLADALQRSSASNARLLASLLTVQVERMPDKDESYERSPLRQLALLVESDSRKSNGVSVDQINQIISFNY